jgi:hypothetical protein
MLAYTIHESVKKYIEEDDQNLIKRCVGYTNETDQQNTTELIAAICKYEETKIKEIEEHFLELIETTQHEKTSILLSCLDLYDDLCGRFSESSDFHWCHRGSYAGSKRQYASLDDFLAHNDPFDVIQLFRRKISKLGYESEVKIGESEKDLSDPSGYKDITILYLCATKTMLTT